MQADQKYAGLFAKVRALYAKRLKEADYKRLAASGSLSELVSYLKHFTAWEGELNMIDEFNVRRGYLESVLRRAFFKEYDHLMKFVPIPDRELMGFVIKRNEIELILTFLRLMSLDRLEDFSAELPVSFSRHSHLNLPALQNAKSYLDMLTAVRKTEYYGALSRLAPWEDGKPIDYNTIETVLWQIYYEKLLAHIRKNYKGDIKKTLLNFLGSRIDIENISRVIRLKKSFPVQDNDLFVYLMRITYKTDRDFLRALFNTKTDAEMLELLKETPYRKVFESLDIFHFKVYSQDYMVEESRRVFFRSPPSVYVAIVYLILKEAELMNLVRIVESVRYGINPENIMLM